MAESHSLDIDRVKKKRISQADFPVYSLQASLRVPRVLRDEFAGSPTGPLDVAKAIGMSPTSGPFRTLTGAAVAYGLTTSGGQARNPIALTKLGKSIIDASAPDHPDLQAALLAPRIIREFLTRYNGSPLPSQSIAKDVLFQLGVPQGMLERAYGQLLDDASKLGIIDDVSGKAYVRLDRPQPDASSQAQIAGHGTRNDFSAPKPGMAAKAFVSPTIADNMVATMSPVLQLAGFQITRSLVDIKDSAVAIIHLPHPSDIPMKAAMEIGAAAAVLGDRFILLTNQPAKPALPEISAPIITYSGNDLDKAGLLGLISTLIALQA